jgi:hypothetical protein
MPGVAASLRLMSCHSLMPRNSTEIRRSVAPLDTPVIVVVPTPRTLMAFQRPSRMLRPTTAASSLA